MASIVSPADDNEISLEEALSSFLEDDLLNDVSLEGSDGVLVQANRRLLAAQSNVFRSLLCGEFQEATSDVVKIGFTGCVMKEIVEYAITRKPSILMVDTNENSPEPPYDMREVQTLVSLHSAATYFQFPGLAIKAEECLMAALVAFPSLSFAVVEACNQETNPAVKDVQLLATTNIRQNRDNIATSPKVAFLSFNLMSAFLQDENIEMDEKELFDMLRLWSDSTIAECNLNERAENFSILLEHINLERVRPSVLEAEIEGSGLIPAEKLMHAYKLQALAAEELHGVVFHKKRRIHPLWTSSSLTLSKSDSTDFEVDLLDCPPIYRGVWQWTIEILYPCKATWLGVALATSEVNKQIFLGNQKVGWVYGSTGAAIHSSQCNKGFPKFEQGSRVTMTLDLLPNKDGNGVLYASIDEGPIFNIFEGMRYELDGDQVGFVPAVSLRLPGRVDLLDIHEVAS